MVIYLGIFLFKILEDALATLRLIVVNNGKKLLGAILQFIVTIVWVILTGYVLIDFMKDIYKIIAFSLGAFVGSYLGSFLEEKIALGTNCFIIKINNYKKLIKKLNNNYILINDNIVVFTSKRKNTYNIIKKIKKIDKDATIIIEKAKSF